jgi:hypothetical protein
MKTTAWKSMVSALALALFLWLASGSLGIPEFGDESPEKKKEVYSENESTNEITYSETTTGNAFLGGKFKKEVIGKQDAQGRWHGHVATLYITLNADGAEVIQEAETGHYYHGIRIGQFTRTIRLPQQKEFIMCFNMGVLVLCPQSELGFKDNPTAFSLLQTKYTWFLHQLNMMEVADQHVMSFMDAIETELASHQLEADSFDIYYDRAVSSVSANETHKSIADYINFLTMEESANLIRGNEFRMAVLKHFRTGDIPTFNILKDTYPGYLELLFQAGGSEEDVRHFCEELEARMMLDGLSTRRLHFSLDSVDFRMARTLFGLMFEEKSFSDLLHLGRHIIQTGEYHLMPSVKTLLQSRLTKKSTQLSPQDISYIVVYTMLMRIEEANLVRRAVREATYFGDPQLPVVTTSEPVFNQANGIGLTGHVIDDGGSEVTHRGIAWGTIYNPTTDNNTVAAGSGTGMFTVTLSGLTEGQTYYARAWATNSEGTAYGNVVMFEADQSTSLGDPVTASVLMSVFPIPARSQLNIEFQTIQPGGAILTLLNANGQVIRRQVVAELRWQTISMDIEGLRPGIYFVRYDLGGLTETLKVMIQ